MKEGHLKKVSYGIDAHWSGIAALKGLASNCNSSNGNWNHRIALLLSNITYIVHTDGDKGWQVISREGHLESQHQDAT